MGIRPAFAIATALAMGTLAAGGPASAADSCRPSALKGAYIFALSGFKITGESAAQRTPFAQSGREIFAGDGTLTGVGTASLNGAVVKLTWKGTYTLGADCAGTVTISDNTGETSHFDIFATPDGSNFTYVQTDKGVVNAGWERRQ